MASHPAEKPTAGTPTFGVIQNGGSYGTFFRAARRPPSTSGQRPDATMFEAIFAQQNLDSSALHFIIQRHK